MQDQRWPRDAGREMLGGIAFVIASGDRIQNITRVQIAWPHPSSLSKTTLRKIERMIMSADRGSQIVNTKFPGNMTLLHVRIDAMVLLKSVKGPEGSLSRDVFCNDVSNQRDLVTVAPPDLRTQQEINCPAADPPLNTHPRSMSARRETTGIIISTDFERTDPISFRRVLDNVEIAIRIWRQ